MGAHYRHRKRAHSEAREVPGVSRGRYAHSQDEIEQNRGSTISKVGNTSLYCLGSNCRALEPYVPNGNLGSERRAIRAAPWWGPHSPRASDSEPANGRPAIGQRAAPNSDRDLLHLLRIGSIADAVWLRVPWRRWLGARRLPRTSGDLPSRAFAPMERERMAAMPNVQAGLHGGDADGACGGLVVADA